MTIASTLNKDVYQGNGVTTQWPITFPFTDASQIQVYITDANGNINEITTDYIIDTINKKVIYPGYSSTPPTDAPPTLPTGYDITLYRILPLTQEVALSNQGAWDPDVIEKSLDRITMIHQQLQEQIDRTVQVAINETGGHAEAYATSCANSATSAANSASSAATSASQAAQYVESAEAAATNAAAATNTTSNKSIGAYCCGVKTHQAVLPVRAGTTSIPVARFTLNGIGWAAGLVKSSSKVRVTVKAGEIMSTSEFGIFRNGNKYRADFQSVLSGGSDALNYYALSRGSCVLPKGASTSLGTSPGYLSWKNTASTTQSGSHNHMNGGLSWNGVLYNGMTDYQCGDPYSHHHTITELSADGAHGHTATIDTAFKINAAAEGLNTSAANSAVDNHAELGTASAPKFWPTFYSSSGVAFNNHYTPQTTDYMELRVDAMDSNYANSVEVIIEFLGLNQTIWFYDGEQQKWNDSFVGFGLGDSLIESVDLGGTVPTPSSGVYGSNYRFIWTDILGLKNYGIGGQKTNEILARTNVSGSTFSIDGNTVTANIGVINGGINDCIQKVLYNHGKKFAASSYESSWNFTPLDNIKSLVAKMQTAGIKPYLIISPAINAAVYSSKNTLQLSDFSGNNVVNMPASYWDEIAELWKTTKTQIQIWANINFIETIDWYTPTEVTNFNPTLSHDGIHFSFAGYNVITNLVYDSIYRHVAGSSYLNVSTSPVLINASGIQRPTINIGTVTTGSTTEVTNVGTLSDAIFDFVIPKGADGKDGTDGTNATFTIGNVTNGTTASVTNSGTANAAVLDFVLPKGTDGKDGSAATISIGSVTTVEPGIDASVTNSGTTNAAVLNFIIPKGAQGDAGSLATQSTAGVIRLAGDISAGTGDAPELKASGVTAGSYNGPLQIAVNSKGLTTSVRSLTTAEQTIPCGFSLTVIPAFGLASGKVVLPFAMKITQVDICSTTAAGADLTPSASTNMLVYQNGTSILTQSFSAANTTNATVTLNLAVGDKIYISQSAINGTAQVTMSFKGVKA